VLAHVCTDRGLQVADDFAADFPLIISVCRLHIRRFASLPAGLCLSLFGVCKTLKTHAVKDLLQMLVASLISLTPVVGHDVRGNAGKVVVAAIQQHASPLSIESCANV
jgi:hypothetical protein